MKKRWLYSTLTQIWLSKRPRLLFLVLCFFEYCYKFIFFIHQKYRRLRGGFFFPAFKVISVGNLSIGGTGKSVLISYLAERLGPRHCAIIARGYGGSLEKTGESHVVSDGISLFASVGEAGDEACMFAEVLDTSVIIGKNRKKSADCVDALNRNRSCCDKIQYLLLDDAYQNHHLKKDIEILLLDARQVLGNNHCLPAGPLREKNYSKADIIILTHANALLSTHHHLLKNIIFERSQKRVFSAAHGIRGIKNANGDLVPLAQYPLKVFLVAGIGSFEGFKNSVQNIGLTILGQMQFIDHHQYIINDLENIALEAMKLGCQALITTEKDWTKISALLAIQHQNKLAKALPWFMVSIGFQFLYPEEEVLFFDVIKERLTL